MKYKLYLAVLLATLAYLHPVFGKKLEGWAHPEIQGSVEPTALVSASRNPKLFWGTTTTSITTLSTTTACYTTAAAITTACSKKKRAIFEGPIEGHEVPEMILPSSSASGREGKNIDQTPNPNQITDLNQLASVREGQEELEPRFFIFYWYTSTVTSTSTTITKTTTFTLAGCTPASIAYSLCG